MKGGQRFECLTSTLDVFPTILDYAGAEIPATAAGKNLRPIIDGKTTRNREILFGAIYPAFATKDDQRPERDNYAIYARDKGWKYILYLQDVKASLNGSYLRIQSIATEYPTRKKGDQDLYDLAADPYELKNLAGDPAQAERMKKMQALAFKWWKDTGGKKFDTRPASEAPAKEKKRGRKRKNQARPEKKG